MADAHGGATPPSIANNHDLTATIGLTANEVITTLELAPHPEGGFFRETFRDPAALPGTQRALSTAIYFLLPEGVVSRWHTVDAVETWHWYAGAPLRLSMAAPGDQIVTEHRLGPALAHGETPQAIVPTGHWQQAESLGAWTLVGCTVAPGFEFSGFTMAPPGWQPGR